MQLHGLLRRVRAETFEWSGVNAYARQRLDGSCAAVLLYHRVLPRHLAEELAVEPGMFVTPETFRRHLEWLDHSYRVLPLSEIVRSLAVGRSLPKGAVAITFDDGWRDNYEYAFPELERRSLTATVFLVTERVGSDSAFWPDEVCRRMQRLSGNERRQLAESLGASRVDDPIQEILALFKRLPEDERSRQHEKLVARTPHVLSHGREIIDWDEVKRADAQGIDFESHGASHTILTRVTPEAAERELRSSLGTLRERGLARHALFAYPNGGYSRRIAMLANTVGYQAAFTTEGGLTARSWPPMALPRLQLHDDISRSRSEFRSLVPGRPALDDRVPAWSWPEFSSCAGSDADREAQSCHRSAESEVAR